MAKEAKKTTSKKTAKDTVNALSSASGILDNKDIVNALCYIPYFVGPIAMYFLAKNKDAAMHHIKYSVIIAVVAVLLLFILNEFSAGIITLAYLILSGFFAFKAFRGEAVKVEILDTVEEKVSSALKK